MDNILGANSIKFLKSLLFEANEVKDNIEFELVFYDSFNKNSHLSNSTYNYIEARFKPLLKFNKIEYFIDFKNPDNQRARVFIEKNKIIKTEKIIKNNLGFFNDLHNESYLQMFNIVPGIKTSTELPLDKYDTSKTNFIRYTEREYFNIPNLPNWSFEINKRYKINIPKKINTLDYIKNMDKTKNCDYSLEIEYKGPIDLKYLNIEELDNLFKFIYTNYDDDVKRIYNNAQSQKGARTIGYTYANLFKNHRKKNTILNNVNTQNFRINSIGSKVVSASKKQVLDIWKQTNDGSTQFAATEKTDGLRGFLHLNINTDNIIEWLIWVEDNYYEGIIKYTGKIDEKLLGKSIFDGEVLKEHMHLFDAVSIGNISFLDNNYKYRLEQLNTHKKFIESLNIDKFKIKIKNHYILTTDNWATAFKHAYDTKTSEGIPADGIVCTNLLIDGYNSRNIYWKIKDYKHNTIDALLKKIPTKDAEELIKDFKLPELKPKHDLYVVMVGVSLTNGTIDKIPNKDIINYSIFNIDLHNEDYIPYPFFVANQTNAMFLQSDQNLDDKIWELSPTEDGSWEPDRLREDKTSVYHSGGNMFGNDYNIAYDIIQIIRNPITIEELQNPTLIKDIYFVEISDEIHKRYEAKRNYDQTITSILLDEYIFNSNSLLDIAAGRGGNIRRQMYHNIQNIIAIDEDVNALFVLESKAQQTLQNIIPRGNPIISLKPEQAAINNKFKLKCITHNINSKTEKDLIEKIKGSYNYPSFGIKSITLFWCIHYFCASKQELESIANICRACFEGNNVNIIITCLDGKKVDAMLNGKETGSFIIDNKYKDTTYTLYNKDDDVWQSITKKYDKYQPFGSKIGMYLPTIDTDIKDEYLVDIDELIKIFKPRKHTIKSYNDYDENYFNNIDDKLKSINMLQTTIVLTY